MKRHLTLVAVLVLLASPGSGAAGGEGRRAALYLKDVKSACKQIARHCRSLLRAKGIDWKQVTRRFEREARSVRSDAEHLALLVRLVARLRDGNADVRKTRHTYGVPYPGQQDTRKGPGMAWCRVGKRLYVKNVWSSARRVGIAAGMEVLRVDGKPAAAWLERRIEQLRDTRGFSTAQHAFQFACHEGLAMRIGTRVDYELRGPKRRVRKRTVSHDRASFMATGPAFAPRGLSGDRDVRYGQTAAGYGYIHYLHCKSSIPYRTEDALRAIGEVPGLILDLRANGGGGFSHDDFLGRFVPRGKALRFTRRYESRGEVHYGGPIVVIVDGLTRGAGETAAGLLKEDGRAYLIGESATAGMAAHQRTLELPSGLFTLHVSVETDMGRLNGGKGIEGIGIAPHEVVAFDPADLARGEDTLIKRAEALFKQWPKGRVPYVPAKFGWRAP